MIVFSVALMIISLIDFTHELLKRDTLIAVLCAYGRLLVWALVLLYNVGRI
jgi:hypothetical protein